jgi:hypothetical protein
LVCPMAGIGNGSAEAATPATPALRRLRRLTEDADLLDLLWIMTSLPCPSFWEYDRHNIACQKQGFL